jgi:hypothetical protein
MRGRSEGRSPVALRRAIHVLARLAIAATCTSSAAAFDAGRVSRAAVVIAARSHAPEIPRREIRPNDGPLTKSRPALQRKLAVQAAEPEEIGRH